MTHGIRISGVPPKLFIGCTCGWEPPAGLDAEDAMIVHVAVSRRLPSFDYRLSVSASAGIAKIDVCGAYCMTGQIDHHRAGRAAVYRLVALIEELIPLGETWQTPQIFWPEAPILYPNGYRGTVRIVVDITRDRDAIVRAGEVMRKAVELASIGVLIRTF